MAEPDPSNVAPWYLRNINQALELNEATGQVFVRTGFEGNIIISGNVNIPGNIDAHISEIGTSGNLTVPWMPVSIDGNSNVTIAGGNVNAAVTGTVAVSGITGNIAGITGNVTVVDGGGSITVDGNVGVTGNVNIGTMPNVNANITGGNVTVTQGTSPWVVSGNVATTIGGTNLDAFGRLRVSNPVTLFDSQNRYIDGEQFSSITATSGNVVYVANESSFNLNVSAASGSSVIRQSKTVQAYQPGKSLLTMNTFAMATLKANLRQRVGYFTEGNGIYFEANGTSLSLVIRSSTTGAVVEERIPQANWNGNTLLSGIVLDPTLTQIFWSDIEWLGVGNVRAGFVINGQFIVCHTFQHANQPGNTTVYMTTATLNPRYEITNTGATSGTSTMKQICSTVISEGGFTPSTKIGYVTNNTSATRVGSSNTVTSLCSIRLNPSYPDAVVIPAQIDLLLLDVRYGQFQLIENATIANASFSNIAGSVVQSAIHTDTITDGTVVYAGLNSSRDEVEIGEDIKKRLQLWRYANGTPSTLTLAVSYTATNADLLYKFGWEELTN
jgi:hypothetical protein